MRGLVPLGCVRSAETDCRHATCFALLEILLSSVPVVLVRFRRNSSARETPTREKVLIRAIYLNGRAKL